MKNLHFLTTFNHFLNSLKNKFLKQIRKSFSKKNLNLVLFRGKMW